MTPAPYSAAQATSIDWYAFLSRPRLPAPAAETLDRLREQSIVVTGAGGSIGSKLSLRLAALHPRRLLLLDASERALHAVQQAIANAGSPDNVYCVLGNAHDGPLLDALFKAHAPQLVFHAAAFKHVPLLEDHPVAAVENNTLATLTLTECAKRFSVPRVALLSTDKAAAPVSILGASKRIAEGIVLAQGGIALRLGNVLGTSGSVSERFLAQIASGQPVTVSAPDAERYFLTGEEAVDLLLTSAIIAPPATLLAPGLRRQHRIVDLANFLIAQSAPAEPPAIHVTGSRPGDKLRESFWEGEELSAPEAQIEYLDIGSSKGIHSPSPYLLAQLKDAVRKRDVPSLVDIVVRLVPSYRPSYKILASMQSASPGVAHP